MKLQTVLPLLLSAACFSVPADDAEDLEATQEELTFNWCPQPSWKGFADCELDDQRDATLTTACSTTSVTRSSYGGTSCSSELVVDVAEGEACGDWSAVKAGTSFYDKSECDCRDHQAYVKAIGMYCHSICIANGCSECNGTTCGSFYCLWDPWHEETVTARGSWNSATETCTVSAKIEAGTGRDHWGNLLQVHGAVVNGRTLVKKPVTVSLVP